MYAVVLEIKRGRIVNDKRPFLLPTGIKEKLVRKWLERAYPNSLVVVANKETLLANPFDLIEKDFEIPAQVGRDRVYLNSNFNKFKKKS